MLVRCCLAERHTRNVACIGGLATPEQTGVAATVAAGAAVVVLASCSSSSTDAKRCQPPPAPPVHRSLPHLGVAQQCHGYTEQLMGQLPYLGVAQQGPGHTQELPLADADVGAALLDRAVQPMLRSGIGSSIGSSRIGSSSSRQFRGAPYALACTHSHQRCIKAAVPLRPNGFL